MDLWMLFVVIALVAIVVEIMVPTLFCINFAVAGIITAIVAVFWGGFTENLILFAILSIASIFLLKPYFEKTFKKDGDADFNSDYMGKIVKVIEPITDLKGAVTIYDERWEARLKEAGEEIAVGADVKIVSNDSTTLFVEKI